MSLIPGYMILPEAIVAIVFALMLVLLLLRVPVALSLGIAGTVGLLLLRGFDYTTNVLGSTPFSSTASFGLTIVPMFILLGMFAVRARVAEYVFLIANRLVGRLPGGLGIATVYEGAEFTFTLATGALPGTPHGAIEQRYLDMVEEASDGRIEIERTEFEAICKMQEVVDCLRDGRGDIGATIADYTPQLFPTYSVVGIPFLNTDVQATTGGLYDMHKDGTVGADMLAQHGLRYVASWPVGNLFIGSAEPVDSMDDLEGLTTRASGPITQATLQTAGLNVNSITAVESYEAVERGVIDSVAGALDFAVNFKMVELLPHFSDPGMGQYTAYGMWWSQSSYDTLPDDLKQVVDEVTAELNGGVALETYNETSEAVCQGMLDAPVVESFTRWPETATEEFQEAVGSAPEDQWTELAEGYGLADAAGFLEDYKAAYEANLSEDNDPDVTLACVDRWQEQNG